MREIIWNMIEPLLAGGFGLEDVQALGLAFLMAGWTTVSDRNRARRKSARTQYGF